MPTFSRNDEAVRCRLKADLRGVMIALWYILNKSRSVSRHFGWNCGNGHGFKISSSLLARRPEPPHKKHTSSADVVKTG